MTHINLIAWDCKYGLSRDVRLVASLLEKTGCQVTVTSVDPANEIFGSTLSRSQRFARGFRWFSIWFRHQLFGRRYRPGRKATCDVNVFFEHVLPHRLPTARINCLLPHQEWFAPSATGFLSLFDLILCKTRHAEAIFRQFRCRTEYVGFTSEDRQDLTCSRDPNGVFHLAGQSPFKGTQAILDLWHRHSEWPLLTVVRRSEPLGNEEAPNVRFITGYMEDSALRRCQNQSAIHLCPSEAEGFGHYIHEALSCSAVVITTDAPPMNELVTQERGLLVRSNASKPQCLGTRYFVAPESLAGQIESALGMSDAAKQQLGARARAWYDENDQAFRRRFVDVLSRIDQYVA